ALSLHLSVTSWSSESVSVELPLEDDDSTCIASDAATDAADANDGADGGDSACRVVDMTAVQSYVPQASLDQTMVSLDRPMKFALPDAITIADGSSGAPQSAWLFYRLGDADWAYCYYAANRGTGQASHA